MPTIHLCNQRGRKGEQQFGLPWQKTGLKILRGKKKNEAKA